MDAQPRFIYKDSFVSASLMRLLSIFCLDTRVKSCVSILVAVMT